MQAEKNAPGEAYSFEVVGDRFHQDSIAAVAGPKSGNGYELAVGARLVPEDGKAHDSNAVGVWIGKFQVGYLTPAGAETYRKRHGGQTTQCKALIVGGWRRKRRNGEIDEKDYGVRLDLA